MLFDFVTLSKKEVFDHLYMLVNRPHMYVQSADSLEDVVLTLFSYIWNPDTSEHPSAQSAYLQWRKQHYPKIPIALTTANHVLELGETAKILKEFLKYAEENS